MRIAIMQPYFIPYAGYFRLLEATDLFVIYDCVQFPRRGWVHRNYVENPAGVKEWLTLPLKKMPRDTTLIKELEFNTLAICEAWQQQLDYYPAIKQQPDFRALLHRNQTPLELITNTLRYSCERLGIVFNTVRSSTLPIAPELRNQERILAICEHLGATEYLNASGGRELYSEEVFMSRGINLAFLPDYQGSYASIIERLYREKGETLLREIRGNL